MDFHYGIIRKTVEMEQNYAHELHGEKKSFWQDVIDTREIFYGVNGVRLVCDEPLLSETDTEAPQFRTLVAFMPAAVQQLTGLTVVRSTLLRYTRRRNLIAILQ